MTGAALVGHIQISKYVNSCPRVLRLQWLPTDSVSVSGLAAYTLLQEQLI
jgi:hypothetical protein